jgi:tetratricopeptide (TPR) repeat protein
MLEFWQEIQYLIYIVNSCRNNSTNLKNVAFRQLAQYTAVMLALLTSGVVNVAPASSQALLPFVSQQDRKDFAREAERLYKSALNLSQFQLYEQAIPRAVLANQLAPERSDILLLLGTLYLQNQKTDKSIEALNKAQAIAPQDANILLSLGTAFFQKGDYNKAIDKLQAGLKINPTSIPGLFDLGNAYYRSKRYPEAIATYEKSVQQKKDFWPALNNIGLISYETNNLPNAIKYWQQAISIEKKAAEPQLALAVALFQQGKQEEAYKLGEAALRNDSRYASIDYLKENLWGEKLLAHTQGFLKTPRIKAALTLGAPEK